MRSEDFYKNDPMKESGMETYQKLGVGMLVIVFSGFWGWLTEVVFYYFNYGMDRFHWQGGNFLPWINLHAIGAVLILLVTQKLRKHPWAVFLLSAGICGVEEYAAGWLVYTLWDGTRYWDYNKEIWNFGNINAVIRFIIVINRPDFKTSSSRFVNILNFRAIV